MHLWWQTQKYVAEQIRTKRSKKNLFKKKSFLKMFSNQKLYSQDGKSWNSVQQDAKLTSEVFRWELSEGRDCQSVRFSFYPLVLVQPTFHIIRSGRVQLPLSCVTTSQWLHSFPNFLAKLLLQLILCWKCPSAKAWCRGAPGPRTGPALLCATPSLWVTKGNTDAESSFPSIPSWPAGICLMHSYKRLPACHGGR